MKKRTLYGFGLVMVLALAVVMTGCGEKMPYEGLNFDDYIKLGEYKGLTVEKTSVKVTDAEIDQRIQESLEAAADETDLKTGDKLQNGDTANIDFTGYIDGKEFEDGTSKDFDLKLGSNSFIEGFESGLVGKKVGETVSLDLKFPDDYQGEKVAGKDVTFKVKINSAKRSKVPEYTDEYVKKNTDYKTKKEYEASVKETLKKEKEKDAAEEQKSKLWSQVMEKTEMIKYPEDELTNYTTVFDTQVDKMAEQYGVDRSQIISQYFGAQDEKSFKAMVEESSKQLIQQEMAIEEIAEKEGLDYTSDEKDAKIEEVKKQGYDEESVKTYTGRTMDQYVHINLLYEKVMDFILENAKIK